MTHSNFKIDFEPIGKRVNAAREKSLLHAVRAAGIQITSMCGGIGICAACKIQIRSGDVTPLSSIEKAKLTEREIEKGIRLACQAYPLSDLKINIPQESLSTPQRLQLEGTNLLSKKMDGIVRWIDLSVPEPTIHDSRADTQRVMEELRAKSLVSTSVSYPCAVNMPDLLRKYEWKIRACLHAETLIAVLPAGQKTFGLAADIGSTKIAAYFIDLESGQIVSRKGEMNPQISFGEDILSRIAYANSEPDGRDELQRKLIDVLNRMIHHFCQEQKINKSQILEAVVVCNTAIHHLFLNLPVKQLGFYPFVPAVSEAITLPARTIELDIAPGAFVYLPNNIAGYVGADHTAMLLASGSHLTEKTRIALDIGTNTEISLIHQGKIYSCSCASGPAFEGAHIKFGMRAAEGAIERAEYQNGKLNIQTIGDKKPVGICGSGILDLVGTFRHNAVINDRGNFDPQIPNVRKAHRNYEYVLAEGEASGLDEPIVMTRADINEIILAKSAIRTGLDILLLVAGIDAEQIEEFVIAGAFGSYLSITNAIEIGMFPNIPLERFEQIGNAAGIGACNLLLSSSLREACEALIKRIHYVELTTFPDFRTILVDNMNLSKR